MISDPFVSLLMSRDTAWVCLGCKHEIRITQGAFRNSVRSGYIVLGGYPNGASTYLPCYTCKDDKQQHNFLRSWEHGFDE